MAKRLASADCMIFADSLLAASQRPSIERIVSTAESGSDSSCWKLKVKSICSAFLSPNPMSTGRTSRRRRQPERIRDPDIRSEPSVLGIETFEQRAVSPVKQRPRPILHRLQIGCQMPEEIKTDGSIRSVRQFTHNRTYLGLDQRLLLVFVHLWSDCICSCTSVMLKSLACNCTTESVKTYPWRKSASVANSFLTSHSWLTTEGLNC